MTHQPQRGPEGQSPGQLSRRELLAYSAAFGSAFMASQGLGAENVQPVAETQSPKTPAKRYDMKKSINLWALPYPSKMTLEECLELCKDAGFDGVEVNYALDGDLTPEAGDADVAAVGEMARRIGIEISGLCSFLFWPYSLTHEDPERRKRGMELALDMIRTAKLLGTENLLVIAGSTYVPWLEDDPPVAPEVCDRRAHEAIGRLIPAAQKAGVYLNVENIFINGYLHSPQEMVRFVDSFRSDRVRVHFDTGNIMLYHFPEHWIPILGKRIQNIHLKEYTKRVHEFNLHTFRPLLDGTTDWPAVLEALDGVGYRGYLTFEYFNPFPHWPETLVYHTSDSLDRMLGRKV
ncbi:MAG TPA: sugar phosphate isomerase/epimerase family protein [Thermoguttaceae bacterium]|nr:sugar phosphate isomerase/epimerase family protein [Thermoguttaceae bacterium]